MIRSTRPVIAGLLCAAALAACKKSNNEYAAGNVAKSMDTAAAASATAVTPTAAKWSPPVIVGFAWEANEGEIALGKLAETKATNPEVRKFGKMMVTDHTAMLAATKKLETKLNVPADTAASDAVDVMNHSRDELKELTNEGKGAAWDKDYINKAVDDHQKVLGKLQDAAKGNTNPEVAKALVDATAKVQAHLTRAQEIQAKLNK